MCPGAPGSWAPFELVSFECGAARRVRGDRRWWAKREKIQTGGSWDTDGFDFGTRIENRGA